MSDPGLTPEEEALLSAHLDGETSSEEEARVAALLASNAAARTWLDGIRADRDLLRLALGHAPVDAGALAERRRRAVDALPPAAVPGLGARLLEWFRPGALAGAAAGLALVGLALLPRGGTIPAPPGAHAAATPAASPTRAPAPGAASPAPDAPATPAVRVTRLAAGVGGSFLAARATPGAVLTRTHVPETEIEILWLHQGTEPRRTR